MAMQINTNVLSLTAQRNVAANESRLATSIERLSTGLRINRAGDDAAGLAISERMSSQIRGQSVAQRNANDAISFAQTAEGALSVMGEALQRMRELTVQSLNGMNTDGDRNALNQEIVQLRQEIERIAQDTTFNGRHIINGAIGTVNFQIGAERGDVLSFAGVDARASVIGDEQQTVRLAQNTNTTAPDYALGTYTDIFIEGAGVDLSNATSQRNILDAINAVSAQTGVTASTETRVDLGALDTTAAFTLTVNTTPVNITAGDTAQDVADLINADDTLDVVASLSNAGNLVLTSPTSEDILLDQGVVGAPPTSSFVGLNATAGDETFSSTITLTTSGSDPITVTGTNADALGFNPGTPGVTGSFAGTEGITIDQVSIATYADAEVALDAIDGAIDDVTSLRAELGALQNRFENVVEVIAVHRENLEAARSRILDADFAAETADLTRAQILQQAGLASLAQANSAPQNILSLLQ
jgi:flagellin